MEEQRKRVESLADKVLGRLPVNRHKPPSAHEPATKRGSVKFHRNYVEAWHNSLQDGTQIHKARFKSAKQARRHLKRTRDALEVRMQFEPLFPAQYIRVKLIIDNGNKPFTEIAS